MKRLGVYYKEKVLSLPEDKLIKREMPDSSDEFRIGKDLFGWKIYLGKQFVECRSEEEARYLAVFYDAGMREIYVPKDEDYLRSILPELERLKARTDEIINHYIDGILNYKIREKIRRIVYSRITNTEEIKE
jgi:hypothetical protein